MHGATIMNTIKIQISNLMKTFQRCPICSMRADGGTELKKLIVTFVNFAKARKTEEQMLSRSKKKNVSSLFAVLRAILIR